MFKKSFLLILLCLSWAIVFSQNIKWAKEGNTYFRMDKGDIVQFDLPDMAKTTLLTKTELTPTGKMTPLSIKNYFFSADGSKILLYTNTQRVWRYETRGDYWVFDKKTKSLNQLGKSRPMSSLMFAKFSPDGSKVGYVSERNVYVENLADGKITQLTQTNGTPKLINGTFDWVYEEEFDCRDGFRWSPDSKKIAYWQIDANQIRDYLMLNTTDSIYPRNVPVEYPKVGEFPSPYKIGVVDIESSKTIWMNIPDDPRNTYVPRMEWAMNANELLIQQLNRKQNHAKLILCNVAKGSVSTIYEERDDAWIDLQQEGTEGYWHWLDGGKEYLWTSEKDGWRHVYRISRDGKKETLITKGKFDVISISRVDATNGYLYFMASPDNATQKYLFRTKLDGSTDAEKLSPANQIGNHSYQISPNGKYALHSFQNNYTPSVNEWLALPEHKALKEEDDLNKKLKTFSADNPVEYFQVKTVDGVTLDGYLVKPKNFNRKKKYPILFHVYSEPAAATVGDNFGISESGLYAGDLAEDGYIYASLDNRGTPSPKGRSWRKAIYRNIGTVNIRDQAMGATEMFKKYAFIDTSRVAVWGWSGGGSTTLNLLFQYPDIYKTGIAVAAVANQLTYDNIYQERYMGIPQENLEDFVKGSPITHAKNLQGNLLYIHGTGDDNVHYQNAEMLLNELIKHNKYFQFMPYPNRSHGIYEGEGTSEHLANMFTTYLRLHCPAGAR